MPVGGSLGLQKATNARDLGGYRTVDGRVVRSGVLYRANALNRLTDDDVAAVGRLGLACVIDFRHQREVELIGADRLPTPAPSCVALPIFDPEHDVFTAVSAVLRGQAGEDALVHLREDAQGSGGAAALMIDMYRRFVTAEGIRRNYATAVRLVADPARRPLLFHCSAGKDRTGWLAAVVLLALGVDRDTAMADYLRTTEFNAGSVDFLLAMMSERVAEPDVIRPLIDVRPEYLQAALTEVDTRYGGIDGYLREGLGLDDAVLADLRDGLLEP